MPLTSKQLAQRRMRLLSTACAKQEELVHHHKAHPVEELQASAHLVMLGMGVGSKAEVFFGYNFYSVTVEEKTNGGFYFTFDESDDEFGFVYTNDFLKTWRLYEEGVQAHLTNQNVARMRDSDD